MNLPDDKQQNIQRPLDFSALTGESRGVAEEETESSGATSGNESPARTDRLMEEVCERENLKEALRQVKANQGSAGVDGMTVGGITDYLKQHWPTIRERLLNGTYEPQPVRRVEIPKPAWRRSCSRAPCAGIWKIVSWCIRTRQSCSLRWTAPPKATTEKQIPPFARNDMSS